MKKLSRILMFFLAFSLSLSQANDNRKEPLRTLVNAQNDLGFGLFFELLNAGELSNVLISPTSIYWALSITYNGSSGATQKEMAKILGCRGLSLKEFNQANLLFKNLLTAKEEKVIFKSCNSLWIANGAKFKKPFLEANKQYYTSELKTINFTAPEAVPTINNWVNEKTEGKIKKIIDELPEDIWAIILNALYFKAHWQVAFDEKNTKEYSFYLANGQEKPHPFMYQKGKFYYVETPEFEALTIPYKNNSFAMDIFLPRKDVPLTKLASLLASKSYHEWLDMFDNFEGEIYLPRFKLTYETSLKETLKKLGMERAFDQNLAEFDALAEHKIKGRPFIGDILHKTFIEVTEEGTEAAAVTGVFLEIKAVPKKPFVLRLDRPFIYIIRNLKTQAVTFLGVLADPEQ
jgi:serpin B